MAVNRAAILSAANLIRGLTETLVKTKEAGDSASSSVNPGKRFLIEGNVDKSTAGVWEGDFVNGGTLALVPGGNLNDFDPGGGVAQSNA